MRLFQSRVPHICSHDARPRCTVARSRRVFHPLDFGRHTGKSFHNSYAIFRLLQTFCFQIIACGYNIYIDLLWKYLKKNPPPQKKEKNPQKQTNKPTTNTKKTKQNTHTLKWLASLKSNSNQHTTRHSWRNNTYSYVNKPISNRCIVRPHQLANVIVCVWEGG